MKQKDIELKWQKKWKKERVFEPKIDPKKQKYVMTVAYPYANSAMHIGHGRTFTMADIIARYQRVLGKNVLYPMAFHISGTPVLAVADGIAKGDKKQIKITKDAIADYTSDKKEQSDLIKSFKDPFKIAEYFSGKIEETFDSVGLSIDWSRQFSTGDEIYQKFIQWQYEKLNEKKILVQGKYPILYSVADKNAVGEDDIKDADIDKVTISEMKYIKFKIKGKEEFLVAATLRPDSIFGTTNLYIKPNMTLSRIKVGKEIWIVSKKSVVKFEHQFDNVEHISDCYGKDFLDDEVIVPILDKIVPIYPMAYPDENHGTGIVYSSPADSPHDYIFLFELKHPAKKLSQFKEEPFKLTPITKTKDKKGNEIKYKFNIPAFDKLLKYDIHEVMGNSEKLEQAKQELYKEAHFGATMINCEGFEGTPLKNGFAANKVTEKLKKLNLGGVFYETSRRAKTRGNDDVIVANLEGQWFLNYRDDEIKEPAYNLLDDLEFLPEKLRATQRGYLKWVEMRPCARRRGIGTKLPQDNSWIIEPLSDSTIYQMLYLVHHIIEREKIHQDCLSPMVFDYILLGKGNVKMISEENNISEKILNEMKEQVDYWEGVDMRYTNSGHMSNHLSFLIYHYALIFPKKNWPKNISVGGYLIKDGAKISKSKGNGIPLIRMRDTYGVDMYRLYIALAANFDVEMDFRDDDIYQLEKKFNKFKEIISSSSKRKVKPYKDFSDLEKWLISRFYSKANEYFEMMNDMRIREAYVSILYEFLNDVAYYERRSNENSLLDVIRFIAKDYVILMSPVVSHICEELGEKLGEKDYMSLSSYNTDSKKYVSKELEQKEGIIEKVIAGVYKTIDVKGIKKLKKITLVQASDKRFDLFDAIGKNLRKTKNVKEIFSTLNKDFSNDTKFIQKFVPKTLGSGLSYYMNKKDERKFIEDLIPFFKEEFNCEIEIVSNDDLENQVYAIPSELGVILE